MADVLACGCHFAGSVFLCGCMLSHQADAVAAWYPHQQFALCMAVSRRIIWCIQSHGKLPLWFGACLLILCVDSDCRMRHCFLDTAYAAQAVSAEHRGTQENKGAQTDSVYCCSVSDLSFSMESGRIGIVLAVG